MRAIDADKIKQRLQEHHDFYANAYGGYKNLPVKEKARVDEITSCISEVVNAPTLDVAPVRHGEWILRHIGAGHYWECSVCHKNPCIYVTKDTKFCPNCGAKMDAGQEETK